MPQFLFLNFSKSFLVECIYNYIIIAYAQASRWTPLSKKENAACK